MKAAYLLAIAASFAATAAHAQAQPKKGDSIIIIQTADSANVALKKLGETFVSQGYVIERYDTQFYTLRTSPKTLQTTFSPIVWALASATKGANSTLRISGEYRATVMGRPLNDVANLQGSEKGVPSSSFRAIEKVALAYPGGKVSYSR